MNQGSGKLANLRVTQWILFSVAFHIGISLTSVLAEDYKVTFKPDDGFWSGSEEVDYVTGAIAHADHNSDEGRIFVDSSAWVTGAWAEAKAWIQKDFTYDHHSHSNHISVSYSLHGLASRVPNGENTLQVTAQLFDVTGGGSEHLQTAYGYNMSNRDGEIHQPQGRVGFSAVLQEDHQYRIRIRARAYCNVPYGDTGSASLDINSPPPNLPEYSVRVWEAKVFHKHTWTTTRGGTTGYYQSHVEWEFAQTKYNEADELRLYVDTGSGSDDAVQGWKLQFSDFDASNSQRESETRIRAWAWIEEEPPIERDEEVILKGTLHFSEDAGCGNEISYDTWRFYPAEGAVTLQSDNVAPDHSWWILRPVQLPNGQFEHTFILRNTDLLDPLNIQSLTFKATTERYETLSEVDYSDGSTPTEDFTLDVASSPFQHNIITEDSLSDGYIYLSYYVIVDDTVVLHTWGGHPVGRHAGAVPDGNIVPGTPLRLEKINGDIIMTWDPSCADWETDYSVYEGTLGDPTSHLPLTCSTGGLTTMTLPTGGNDASYYIVVPHDGAYEGSYGVDINGNQRPGSADSCFPQGLPACN
jgi:hypothetical protein